MSNQVDLIELERLAQASLAGPSLRRTEWCVITGAPGAGKTTLIAALASHGFRVQADTARAIIQQEIDQGRTTDQVRQNEAMYRRLVFLTMVLEAGSIPKNELIFLDYALPDNIAFTRLAGLPVEKDLWDAARLYRYRRVFLLRPLPLLQPDPIRKEGEDARRRLAELIQSTYLELGYQPVEVPVASVEQRVSFVIQRVHAS